MKNSMCWLAFLAAFVSPCCSAQDSGHSESNLVGDWRGSSVCEVRESACHDEDSLYHVTRIKEKPNWFSMKGDKIVDGKAISMGAVECRYDSEKSVLTCELPGGVLRFTIHGTKMEGTMTLQDGTLWRKLALTKAAPSPARHGGQAAGRLPLVEALRVYPGPQSDENDVNVFCSVY